MGSYMCNCKTGFTGNGVLCTDLNECYYKNNSCHKFATCQNTEGSYICECEDGFRPDTRNASACKGKI